MNSNEIARHLDEIAGDNVPANADLWPQLRAQVGTRKARRATPRRRAMAMLTAAVVVLALALGALSPAGTNAATGALNLVGLQPIALATGGPGCVGPNGTVDPIYTPAETGNFTVINSGGEPQPGMTSAIQAMQMTCPEGYELNFSLQPVEGNAVLSFFGVTAISSSTAVPGCVGETGRIAVIQTPAESNAFTITMPDGSPMPAPVIGSVQLAPATAATAAAQISCPEGYQLTFSDK